jgi:predicted transcriptional regulator
MEDGVICLVCGRTFRHLTNTHLAHHGLTSDAYKVMFGYNGRRSLMARAVRRLHARNAVRRGLADMIGRRSIVADPALRARAGAPERARSKRS